jgi:hypothetical protein
MELLSRGKKRYKNVPSGNTAAPKQLILDQTTKWSRAFITFVKNKRELLHKEIPTCITIIQYLSSDGRENADEVEEQSICTYKYIKRGEKDKDKIQSSEIKFLQSSTGLQKNE